MKIDHIITDSEREGILRTAAAVAEDISLVTGYRPIVSRAADHVDGSVVLYAGISGEDELTDKLAAEAGVDISYLAGKRECFGYFMAHNDLVVVGSDLLGLEYGLFGVSEYLGVTPLVYWGDAVPERRQDISIDMHDLAAALHLSTASGCFYVSGEPSIKYRGFFINDEWPAFGRWCNEHFGGFTAKCYEQVFLFLLRMRGNYMWPAMWSSTFSEDGPGIASAELADMFGIYMGASHHEPMCRAGAEWQHIYADYGKDNTWSFISNCDAITDFWRDGILRNRPYRNIITIGMRGENDSKLLGADATLADNIGVVKDAILTQHRLIRENISEDLSSVPRMLAIYKEVEDYYYGAPGVPGLREWDELRDVIFMLCEDNFGNMRGLPEKHDLETHKGGYGMYYHFDYHGAPVSYEWQDCVRLAKTREQMCMAYEYGVRDLWIVNVGDIKGVEFPLTYFMSLAYDYDRYSGDDGVSAFTQESLKRLCGDRISQTTKCDLVTYIDGYTRWNSIRHPETMNPSIYSIEAYDEAHKVYDQVLTLIRLGERLESELPDDLRVPFNSMFYFAGQASLNLILLNIEAACNAYCIEHGDTNADLWAQSVERRISYDAQLVAAYHRQLDGKWDHMMDSAHMCFVTWCEEGWSYPTVTYADGHTGGGGQKAGDLSADLSVIVDAPCDWPVKAAASIQEPLFTAVEAEDYTANHMRGDEGWHVIKELGRFGSALKSYPITRAADAWRSDQDVYVEYDLELAKTGKHDIIFTFMARNPVVKGTAMSFRYSVGGGPIVEQRILDESYYTEWMNRDWNQGVMTGVRSVRVTADIEATHTRLRLYPCDPNVVFERMVIAPHGCELPQSYLGAR